MPACPAPRENLLVFGRVGKTVRGTVITASMANIGPFLRNNAAAVGRADVPDGSPHVSAPAVCPDAWHQIDGTRPPCYAGFPADFYNGEVYHGWRGRLPPRTSSGGRRFGAQKLDLCFRGCHHQGCHQCGTNGGWQLPILPIWAGRRGCTGSAAGLAGVSGAVLFRQARAWVRAPRQRCVPFCHCVHRIVRRPAGLRGLAALQLCARPFANCEFLSRARVGGTGSLLSTGTNEECLPGNNGPVSLGAPPPPLSFIVSSCL